MLSPYLVLVTSGREWGSITLHGLLVLANLPEIWQKVAFAIDSGDEREILRWAREDDP
jgi:hypothetical protein